MLIRLFALLLALTAASPALSKTPGQLTVLISIDGFRPDYVDRGWAPNIQALAARGVRSQGMRPSHPSLTFPNHYALVTGLRPDRNGIVDNVMQDPARPGQVFTMSARQISNDRFWWDQATPLWVTAERAGVRTATMFWPGSEVDIQGVRPSLFRPFDQSVPPSARTDQLLAWIDSKPRPGFATLYFDDVDTAGHAYGPDGAPAGLVEAVGRVDAEVGRLSAELQRRGIAANLVLVADHGMAATSADRVVVLDDIAPLDGVRVVSQGSSTGLFPTPAAEAALLAPHPHMTCWRKGDMPPRLHYGTNPRVPPLVCLAETGGLIYTRDYLARRPVKGGGAHGYDPEDPSMAALFVAAGPAFRKGVVLAPFDNVDVYPLLARLIGVTPVPGDGDPAVFRPALKP